jgi:invasion protein IalB
MQTPFRIVAAAFLLALCAPVFAQDAETDTPVAEDPVAEPTAETPAEETPAADPAVDPAPADLSLGTPVDGGEPAIGQPYIREAFGDWSMRCLRAEVGQPEPCELYQLLMDADGNPVAEISMFPLPPGGQAAAGATVVAPLETMLTEQLTLSVDGTAARRYPFSFCNRAGCVARLGFTAEEVEQFKRGSTATLRIVPAIAPDEEVVLTVSLNGFTAGFTAGEALPGNE